MYSTLPWYDLHTSGRSAPGTSLGAPLTEVWSSPQGNVECPELNVECHQSNMVSNTVQCS